MKKIIYSLGISTLLLACGGNSKEEGKTTSHKHNANHYMNKSSFADLVNRFEDPTREEWQKPELVIEKLGDLNNKTIADIGAGTGYFSFRLAKKGANVLALDVDDRFIDYLNENKDSLPVKAIKIPYNNPELDSSSTDAVIIVDTYHHIEDRINYFKKVLHGLKPGGKLLVVDFKKEKTPHGPPIEMKVKGIDVIKELQKVGFSKTIIDNYSLPYQYIVIAKKAEDY